MLAVRSVSLTRSELQVVAKSFLYFETLRRCALLHLVVKVPPFFIVKTVFYFWGSPWHLPPPSPPPYLSDLDGFQVFYFEIEKTQEKWYERHTSHIMKYNKLYRIKFSKLAKKIILRVK